MLCIYAMKHWGNFWIPAAFIWHILIHKRVKESWIRCSECCQYCFVWHKFEFNAVQKYRNLSVLLLESYYSLILRSDWQGSNNFTNGIEKVVSKTKFPSIVFINSKTFNIRQTLVDVIPNDSYSLALFIGFTKQSNRETVLHFRFLTHLHEVHIKLLFQVIWKNIIEINFYRKVWLVNGARAHV